MIEISIKPSAMKVRDKSKEKELYRSVHAKLGHKEKRPQGKTQFPLSDAGVPADVDEVRSRLSDASSFSKCFRATAMFISVVADSAILAGMTTSM